MLQGQHIWCKLWWAACIPKGYGVFKLSFLALAVSLLSSTTWAVTFCVFLHLSLAVCLTLVVYVCVCVCACVCVCVCVLATPLCASGAAHSLCLQATFQANSNMLLFVPECFHCFTFVPLRDLVPVGGQRALFQLGQQARGEHKPNE